MYVERGRLSCKEGISASYTTVVSQGIWSCVGNGGPPWFEEGILSSHSHGSSSGNIIPNREGTHRGLRWEYHPPTPRWQSGEYCPEPRRDPPWFEKGISSSHSLSGGSGNIIPNQAGTHCGLRREYHPPTPTAAVQGISSQTKKGPAMV